MSKRPSIDLLALTSEQAEAMPEAAQRAPKALTERAGDTAPDTDPSLKVKTANLQSLGFKVPPAFRKRFIQCAAAEDLKLNQLLFKAFAAWEEKEKIKK